MLCIIYQGTQAGNGGNHWNLGGGLAGGGVLLAEQGEEMCMYRLGYIYIFFSSIGVF